MRKNYSGTQYATMILTGRGQVTASPDTANINLGIQTTGDNLEAIQSANAQKSQSVLQALQQIGITDIKTIQYSIDKVFDFENGNRIDRGYSVRNILEIKTRNKDQVGYIIDTAVNNGANIVEFVSFEVSDREFYYQQALNLAIEDAIQKSESIAANLGTQIKPIPIRIVENSTLPIQPRQFQQELASTPIIPGDIKIEATVTVEFLY